MKSFVSYLLLHLLYGILFVTCESFASNEVSALAAFKEEAYEDPLLVLSSWNILASKPCDWTGITCSPDGDHVIKLNISGASLRGFLVPELGELRFLQELILHGNKLIGIIPKEIGTLKNLRVLDLGANQLTGPIPPEIGDLTNVVKINLQSNGLTGELPPELGNLRYLQELRLDRNRLQGTVPASGSSYSTTESHRMYGSGTDLTGLCLSSQLKVADFSYNFFVGTIPKCLEYLPRSSFRGNCLQNNETKQRPAVKCGGDKASKTRPEAHPKHLPTVYKSKHHEAARPTWLLALEVVMGTMVGCLFLVAIFTGLQKWQGKSAMIIPWKNSGSGKDHLAVCIDSEILKDVMRFSRQELEEACEDFSNIIGSSPDSLVYKGTIKGGPEIAVVSVCNKEEHWTGYLELYFQREVADLAKLNHENTGKLLGYCRESAPFTRMLVFEYASNGTLYEHLHYGEGCQLSWTRRMKIILGIARGLRYLHTELQPPFTILDLHSSAVYLTDDFSPKLVDFESWKSIFSRSEKNSDSIGSEGPVCILPDSLEPRHLELQANICAFGILLLEIVSGRPPYCKEKGCLLNWAKEYLELPEVMPYIVDPELKHFRYEDLKAICEVVNLCINADAKQPVSMRDICAALEAGIDMSVCIELKASSLAWAELALSSDASSC